MAKRTFKRDAKGRFAGGSGGGGGGGGVAAKARSKAVRVNSSDALKHNTYESSNNPSPGKRHSADYAGRSQELSEKQHKANVKLTQIIRQSTKAKKAANSEANPLRKQSLKSFHQSTATMAREYRGLVNSGEKLGRVRESLRDDRNAVLDRVVQKKSRQEKRNATAKVRAARKIEKALEF